MIILSDISEYRDSIMELLNSTPFNTFFAKAVVNETIQGEIFVDDENNPQTFYILHPYGMSLLLGDSSNSQFNKSFKEYIENKNKTRVQTEWMQTYPDKWHNVLETLFDDTSASVSIDTRINFKFNKAKYLENKILFEPNPDIKITRTDANDFLQMHGSVIPSRFWNNKHDFITIGIGYSLYYKNKLAGIAFSSCVDNNALELGIETCDHFRGKNFAYRTCSALINYCLENNLDPVWACRLSNTGSYKLALKLGLEESFRTPYYKFDI